MTTKQLARTILIAAYAHDGTITRGELDNIQSRVGGFVPTQGETTDAIHYLRSTGRITVEAPEYFDFASTILRGV